jgi:hypothetical protein
VTEPRDDLAGALHRLRDQVRDLVPVPPAAGLRAHARHRLLVRRATAAGLAAVAVVTVVIGGNAVLRPTAGPPVPPAGSPTPSASPAPSPTASPEPVPPAVTPSPRPEPRPVLPVDDPIARVDWDSATISFPPEPGCPDGPVGFTPVSDIYPNGIGPADSYPAIGLDATHAAYGDLTGDGRLEAVLAATCFSSEEAMTSGHGGRLLVVTRADSGQLTALGRVGPPGAGFLSWWVADGRLLIDADPWAVDPADHFVPVPGLALAYQWDGAGFGDWQPAVEYPALVPPDPDQFPPPVRPRAVAAGLGCPNDELRFVAEPSGWGWTATGSGALLAITSRPFQQYLFDLDNTGERLLVTGLDCVTDGGDTRTGLAVFERAGDGWQGISVLLAPAGYQPAGWRTEGGDLVVDWSSPEQAEGIPPGRYRWSGTVLEPVDG